MENEIVNCDVKFKRTLSNLQNAPYNSMSENINALEENINQLAILFEFAEKINNKKLIQIINANLFFTICNFDISIIFKNLKVSKLKWEKSLYLRLLAITIIEFIDDINYLLGKNFRSIISELIEDKAIIIELNIICKKINNIKKENEELLREIRNNVIAHRHLVSIKQYDIIKTLDSERIEEIGIEILNSITELHKYFSKIVRVYKVLDKCINY